MDNISLKKDNEIEEDNNHKLISFSFYITYVFLLTTGTITFIEAMRTNNAEVRNILNLETCISVVAAYFYGKFVDELDEKNINFNEINDTRYVDWSITTPIMLLVLCLAFLYIPKCLNMFKKTYELFKYLSFHHFFFLSYSNSF